MRVLSIVASLMLLAGQRALGQASSAPGGSATPATPAAGVEQQNRNAQSEAEARRVIAAWNQAVNRRDTEGMRDASNFPLIHLGGGKVFMRTTRADLSTDNWPPGAGHGEGWDHSTIDSVEFVQSGPDKVNALVVFSRCRRDGMRYANYHSLWIITKLDGHWGIQCRSSFAP